MRSVITGIFLPSGWFQEYTLGEKLALWRGKISSRSPRFGLWDEMQATDLRRHITRLDLPVDFLHGAHDYTCSYHLARSYFGRIRAPRKGFYTFAESAHSPMFEEPEPMRRILREDVLAGRVSLADIE